MSEVVKVTLNQDAAGPDGFRKAGTEIEVSADEAKELISSGQATAVEVAHPAMPDGYRNADANPDDKNRHETAKANPPAEGKHLPNAEGAKTSEEEKTAA